MNHEVNRQVSDDERHLWARVKEWDAKHPELVEIPIGRIAADQTPVDHKRTIQLVATWRNEGLVQTHGRKTGMLTEYGQQVDEIIEDRVTGESWR
jgi:hypothetical protein